jgi:hypothetical protein
MYPSLLSAAVAIRTPNRLVVGHYRREAIAARATIERTSGTEKPSKTERDAPCEPGHLDDAFGARLEVLHPDVSVW